MTALPACGLVLLLLVGCVLICRPRSKLLLVREAPLLVGEALLRREV